ncbi:MAG: WD40/YVTN/BNR-like repeat-containing protein [Steroidobacteraceae bacterium]
MNRMIGTVIAVVLTGQAWAATPGAFPVGPAVDEAALKALKARSIGPAVMSGRVADIAFDPKETATFYIALGTGGLMKTSTNGATWDGIFDQQPVAAIGAVAVAPSDPKVVWAGTGEANDRNSTSWGDGVYRSTDGGDTWTHAGLKGSKAIARIVAHPGDPKTAYVAAAGDLWNWGGERGCYKTADGGASWSLMLGSAEQKERVGCGDIALDPSDPNVLYAALYARQRKPWSFTYGPEATGGKDLGGIFKSTDGGASWRKLENGLPKLTGRIGLAVHVKNPKIVYAIVQSDEGGTSGLDDIKSRSGGIFRSDDGGESWKRMNALNPRPFYFSQIRVDPENDKRLYVLGFALHVSDNGGESFREDLFEKIHPDNHALAINPRAPNRLLLGTDGGAYQSWDSGSTWHHLNNFPAGEFYRINADMSTPYRICGGLQDNLNWVGPSRTRAKDGILNSDWINIGGGDGFYCVFDAADPEIVYAESQEGFVHRFNLRTGEAKDLRPEPAEGQPAFRFHWNAPLISSRHDSGTMYLGGNHVFRLSSHGEHWDRISPDLSTQQLTKMITVGSGAENYGVVYALAESPVQAGLLWAGTDDGKLWVTANDGGEWTDLSAKLPASAKGQWIYRIEAGGHDAKVAYLAVDAHRMGNYSPLLYRTGDGGKTWQGIASNLPADAPVKVLREDPKNPDLLFAGTEFGLFVSLNRGGTWVKFGGLPTVAVDDILIHPRDADLVIATHGRSLYVVDDIRPLEELTTAAAGQEAIVFTPRKAFGSYLLPGSGDWTGKADFRGDNPPEGALISFYLKSFRGETVEIKIANALDQPVAKFKMSGTPGISRFNWDLKPTKEVVAEYGGEGQKFVRPGEYTISLEYGDARATQKLTVEIAKGIETR